MSSLYMKLIRFLCLDKAQLASHLRLMKLQVGLLINFHEVVLKDGIHRVVNDYKEGD